MVREVPATAEGDLGRTPLAHLLVYALDRRLTGQLSLSIAREDGSALTHVIDLRAGAPVHVRSSDNYARLGELLVEAGAIPQETLDEALALEGLLGDVLLVAGRIDRATLDRVVEEQFVRRVVRLFASPPET